MEGIDTRLTLSPGPFWNLELANRTRDLGLGHEDKVLTNYMTKL